MKEENNADFLSRIDADINVTNKTPQVFTSSPYQNITLQLARPKQIFSIQSHENPF